MDLDRDVPDGPAITESSTETGRDEGRTIHVAESAASLGEASWPTGISQRRYHPTVVALRVVVLALGAALAVIYPFISVILSDRGFSPAEIGLVSSIGAIGFTIAVPAWGHLADVRLGRPRTLFVTGIAGGLAIALLLGPWPPLVIALLFWLFWIFESPWQPLADAVTVNAVGRDYARVRLLTSLSFAIVVIAAGFLYEVTGYAAAYVLFAASAGIMAIAALGVPDVERADLSKHREVGRRALLGSTGVAVRLAPRLALVLGAVGLGHVGILAGFTYLPLRIVALGGSSADVALASGSSALMEIPAMLAAAGVARRIGLRGLFAGSALLYGACMASWTVIEAVPLIVLTRTLTGFAFAGILVGTVMTIGRLLPAELQATGQALYQTIAFGAAAIVANLVGGILYELLGPASVFAFGASLAALAVVIAWLSWPRFARVPATPTAEVGPSLA